MFKPVHIALVASAVLATACGNNTEAPEPAGEPTAARMPDTGAPGAGPAATAPDAGATGAATPTTTAPDPQATAETNPPAG